MLRAISLAFGQLFSGPILTVLGACTLLSIACFVGVWYGIDWAFERWIGDAADEYGVLSVLGGLATLVLAYFTFPIVTTAFVGLFLDHVAAVVERQHYPHLPKAKGLPIAASIGVALRFVAVLLLANVLLLLLLLFVPPSYPVAWIVVNGWLIGREYLELVAMRRVSAREADSLRRRHGFECLATGAAIALLFTVPLLNLVVPVVATAIMVHRYHDWQRADGGEPRP